MSIVNKIVNVIVLILAVTCVVLGTILSKKREQLKLRGDKMAAVIKKVSTAMDKDSGTEFSKKLLTERLELDQKKDTKAAENKTKTLHLTNYDNLDAVLQPFEKQTNDLLKQRDDLAETLNSVSENLKLPETYGADAFKSVKTYEEKKKSLIDNVVQVSARNDALANQIASTAKTLGFTIDPSALNDIKNFRPALNEFASKVEAFKKRYDSCSSFIAKICALMEIAPPSLAGENYNAELSNTEIKFKDRKAEHENTKRQLMAAKDELNVTKENLSKEVSSKKELEKQIAEKNERIENMKKIIAGEGFPLDRNITNEDLLRKITGKVMEVNDKWNFVIIDLSSNSQVRVRKPPFEKEFVPVDIPVGRTLMVSRNDQPVAEVKITRVTESCSVADIVPTKKWDNIRPGDIVKFMEEN